MLLYYKKLRSKDYVEALEVVIQNYPDQNLLKATKLCLTLLVQVTLGTFTILLDSLLEQTYKIRDKIEYWSELKSDWLKAACYLLQTFRDEGILNSSPKRSQTSQSHLETFSGLFSCCFLTPLGLFLVRPLPHCFPSIRFIKTWSARDFSSTLSPLLLIKQESRLRRKFLEESYGESVEKIGVLLSTLNELEVVMFQSSKTWSNDKTRQTFSVGYTLFQESILIIELLVESDHQLDAHLLENSAIQISNLLVKGLPDQKNKFSKSISQLLRPNCLSCNWPWIVALPVSVFTTAKVALSYWQSAIDFMSKFRATINRFFKGWVIRPIEDIIKTLRSGKYSSLAIMSKDGLNSELHSLERMAIDFGREKFKWNKDKLSQVTQKVREGNLTIVLKVWEQEIEVIIWFIS
ncbi:ATP synthase regulation protein NCA2-domain-containing protein [Phakopsora pachyrhizi]|uniref:ATP synthase regulation protein NCA2-domain-containing protein n=2 Tax=Phakopsora pachyrhizi TaxID=170000 RepID=A0AAV0BJP3_PHAPC|nr:ATP synthase regulation protein NCA2-domain-containing protein [Phakopsora pachyrhizi]